MSSLINFTGLASGLDTASIVDALVNVQRAPINRLESKKSDLSSQRSTFETIDGKLDTLADTLNNLGAGGNATVEFASTLTDDDVARVAAGTGSQAGRFALDVTQLAEAQRTYSNAVSSRDTGGTFGTGTLSVTIGGETRDFSVDSETTLGDLSTAINSSDLAVSSTILFDGTNYRLQVTGTETGASNAVSFSETGLSLGLNEASNTIQAAQDAEFTIDGFSFSSATNVVNDAIDGLSISLQDTGSTDVDIAPDTAAFTREVQNFVDQYNSVINDINAQFNVGSARNRGSLFGDSTLRGLQSQLGTALTSSVSIGGVSRLLSEIGIETGRDGTLTLDATELETALSDDADSVRELFAGNGTNPGYASILGDVVDGFADFADGRLKARVDGISSEVSTIDDQIERLEDQLVSYEERLRAEFIALETTISDLNTQNNFLLSQLGAGTAG